MPHRIVELTRQVLRLPIIYFGLALLILLWAAITLQIETERRAAAREAAKDTINIARVFEQNVIRSINEIDQTLKYLRHSHERAPGQSSWQDLLKQSYTASDQTLQLAVADARGTVIASNLGLDPHKTVDLSDREHFRAQQKADDDRLFISKPVIGRVSGKWSVQLTRRFLEPDGSFGGMIVASFDPAHFSKSYSNVDLGQQSGLALVRNDGVIIAGAGIFASKLGANLNDDPAFATFRKVEGDSEEAVGINLGDSIISLRAVKGYPLKVLVAGKRIKDGALVAQNRKRYIIVGAVLSLLIAFAVARVALGGLRYEAARQALMRSEMHARKKSRQLELTLSNMSQGILMVDRKGIVAVINERFRQLLHLSPAIARQDTPYAELVKHLVSAGEFSDGAARIDRKTLDYIEASVEDPDPRQYERTRPDGAVLEVHTEPLPDGGFVRTITDITDRRRDEARLVYLAKHDQLTGLGNRAFLYEKLDDSLASLEAASECALHVVDLDRFQPINEAFGHPTGDKLLKEVAERLRISLRQSDVVTRLGADEFAVLELGGVTRSGSETIARRLCKALAEPYEIDGQRLEISASIGIALAPGDGRTADDLLKAAGLALYAAKAEGRATYRFHNEEMEEFARSRRALEAGMRKALAEERFELYYQSIHSIGSGAVTGYEALIRWRDPERGLVPPSQFISIAEEAGLIVPIGAWVLRKACADMAANTHAFRIAVNLSPLQFRDASLIETVRSALQSSGLAPHRLELEITESTLMQKDGLTLKQLQELRALGVGIAMDDFGTGYSSLSYLHTYPIDRIKIDRSFVSRLGEANNSKAIVSAIVSLARSLGMQTLAEGVETEAQLRLLAELGCTEAQGYYFSPPLQWTQAVQSFDAGAAA